MKYYKRIAGDITGYEIGKIYRDNGEDDLGGIYYSIKDSVKRNPERWKEVTKQEYKNQNDMKFGVKVTPTTSRILQELAFENGYEWNITGGTDISCLSSKYLCFYPDENVITHGASHKLIENLISLEEAIERIEPKPKITIGRYNVEFSDNKIKVGCREYSRGFVMELSDTLNYANIESIKIEGVNVKTETIDEILELL